MSRKYTICEAPIRKMYASDFRLLDNKIVPVYDEEIVQEKGHFYINRFKKIINIEHSTALPDEREIKDLIDFVISHNQVLLYKLLQDPTISYEVKNEYFERIKRASSFLYFDQNDLTPILVYDKADFKNYISQITQDVSIQMTKRK